MTDYMFKCQPMAHQLRSFERSKDMSIYGLFYKMGVGKSKVIVDNAAYLYGLGRINCLIILAPNGVHRKWLREDIPLSMPDHVQYQSAVWESGNAKAEREAGELLRPGNHLRIFCANIEALASSKFCDLLKRLVLSTSSMVVLDESHTIKNHVASRSKKLQELRPHIKYRRILTGSAAPQSPVDLYGQMYWLDPEILGHSITAYKNEYCILEPKDGFLVQGIMRKNPRMKFAPQIVRRDDQGQPMYKNLDLLRERIAPYVDIVEKNDALDLPPKVYVQQTYTLPTELKRLYNALLQQQRLDMELHGVDVTPKNKLVIYTRLQQLLSGFTINDDGEEVVVMHPSENPRIKLLMDIVESYDGQGIIWCRFTKDVEFIAEMLKDDCVTYYGDMTNNEREQSILDFQSGKKRWFIGTAKAGGVGLNLTAAELAIYYSNTYSYGDREQSEDRCHRKGTTHDRVTYIDLVAENTIDELIQQALKFKGDVEAYLMASSVNEALKRL